MLGTTIILTLQHIFCCHMQFFNVTTCSLFQVLIFYFLKKNSGFLLIIYQQTQKSEDITNMIFSILLNTSFKVGLTRFRGSFCRYIGCFYFKKREHEKQDLFFLMTQVLIVYYEKL